MARRFRRRRSGGLWVPVLGNRAQNNDTDNVVGLNGYTPVTATGEIIVTADEVTFDYAYNPWEVQSTAADFSPNLHSLTSGGEWRLRRIVGKIHASMVDAYGGDTPTEVWTMPNCEYAAGYIVLKTDEEGAPLTDLDEVNPLVQESADDPWIWRRKWILRSANGPSSITTGWAINDKLNYYSGSNYPYNTALFGSVADGGHIDQKTNRRIHRQERLFFMSATRMYAPVPWTVPLQQALVFYKVDHRFFGGLLTGNKGNRGNASR